MTARKGISKKLRFEVFKRDSFKCQYCGRPAPDVILEIDHIKPASKEGETDILNLVTACKECNRGKGAKELSDNSIIVKKKRQLDELQERREQLEMILEWQNSLYDLEMEAIIKAAKYFEDFVSGYSINESGYDILKKLLKKYGFAEILECMTISADQYIKLDKEGNLIPESVQKAFNYIGNIAACRKNSKDKPYLSDLYYIRGIVRKRFYCNEWKALKLLERAYLNGYSIDELKEIAFDAPNWTTWHNTMEDLTAEVSP
jgi:hypothetical protein